MTLPIMTSIKDVEAIINYLKTKATGASIEDAKSALDKRVLDSRKITAFVTWGIVTRDGNRLVLSDLGKRLSRSGSEGRISIYSEILRAIKPYHSALEYAFHQELDHVTNVDVASHWHEHHKDSIGSTKERTIKDMAICFFHLCQAANLGGLVMGRRGQPTRLVINAENLSQYIAEESLIPKEETYSREIESEIVSPSGLTAKESSGELQQSKREELRVFISHSKNKDIVDQVKTMLELGDIYYTIAEEQETAAIPVPDKVMSAMRSCNAAIICVTADEKKGTSEDAYTVNQNVLIEIGAAFVLYDRKVILVWDDRVKVPSNLQGLYRCAFSGNELSWSAGMRLMKAVAKFRTQNT